MFNRMYFYGEALRFIRKAYKADLASSYPNFKRKES